MYELLLNILSQSWLVLGEMAPYLLFGFAMAGGLSVLISPEWTERHLGGRGLRPVLEAALWGIPLPLCSCSVIPVAASMRRHGASRAATTAFLLSTPQTGVDSIAASYAMLGPVFAAFRPVAALVSGILGGILVLLFGEDRRTDPGGEPEPAACTEACCTGDRTGGLLWRAVRYGFVTLPRDLAAPLAVGVLLAGAVAAVVNLYHVQTSFGGGLASILILMAVGIPLYVCATASVPIAAGLICLGASPGAALAFLIAGAATNFSTLPTIWKVLGRRTTILYLLTVALSAVLCGLLLDLVMRLVGSWMPQLGAAGHTMGEGGWWSSVWAVALLAVLVLSYPLSRPPRTPAEPTGEKTCCHEA
ncbi:MAG: SO_0444 family Cu/Zn efflux transporter [Thermoguttaceae bacterium]|jgi:hypothetical protein